VFCAGVRRWSLPSPRRLQQKATLHSVMAAFTRAVAAVVLGMDSSNVDSVFIAGKPVKWRGRLVDVDVPRLLARAERSRAALLARAGRSPDPI